MISLLRALVVGVGTAAVVSVAGQAVVAQALEPHFGIFGSIGLLFIVPAILLVLAIARATPKFRAHVTCRVVAAALVAGLLINFLPIPARSLWARVGFYAELSHYKDKLDAECDPAGTCNDPSRVTTLITGGFGSIINGIARDDSGALLEIIKHHERAPNPLQGCENGIVHLYGPYFHWGCG
jgi:hypothetical protein